MNGAEMARKVLIETCFRPDPTKYPVGTTRHEMHLQYNRMLAKNVCLWAVRQGYNPYASHLFFPQFLSDEDPTERALGIQLGLEWGLVAQESWFVVREREMLSRGQLIGLKYATESHRMIRYFRTGDNGQTLKEVTQL